MKHRSLDSLHIAINLVSNVVVAAALTSPIATSLLVVQSSNFADIFPM